MVIAPLEENISSLEATTSDNTLSVRPTILVFDSGVGGLSVYREVKNDPECPLYLCIRQ